MCGILGIIDNKNSIDPLVAYKMSQMIKHRGPDDEGFFCVDGNNFQTVLGSDDTNIDVWNSEIQYKPTNSILKYNLKQKLILGHRRLSIIDLTPCGHNPMSYLNRRYWIVYNGEIYNYLEIKNELMKLGYDFITQTDTEVILASYHEWGVECFNKFNGMWAIALFDSHTEELILCRDRFGIKPLYYYFTNDGKFSFGSEIKQFTVLKEWEAKLNHQRAYDYLVYSLTDHTYETMFAGVYQLEPGHYYKCSIKAITNEKTNKLDSKSWYKINNSISLNSFDKILSLYKELFKDSIKLHLRSDVPIGTALSGGLDSSAIVSEINTQLSNSGKLDLQKTFSSCSLDSRFDEKYWMDIVVKHNKVSPHFIYPDPEDIFDKTDDIIWYQDEPYQSQSVFLGFKIFETAKKNNVKVLINGQGADEYLGGYGQFNYRILIKYLLTLNFSKFINEISDLHKLSGIKVNKIIKGILLEIMPISVKNILKANSSEIRKIEKLINFKILKAKKKHPLFGQFNNDIKSIIRNYTFHFSLPRLLRWEDRNSMANSIEARVPFLDYRLFEIIYNLPFSYHLKDGYTKSILRNSLKGVLPDEIISRRDKKGFITPEEGWIKGDFKFKFRNELIDSIKNSKSILNNKSLNYYDKIVSNELPFSYSYWRLILFGKWLKKFNIKL